MIMASPGRSAGDAPIVLNRSKEQVSLLCVRGGGGGGGGGGGVWEIIMWEEGSRVCLQKDGESIHWYPMTISLPPQIILPLLLSTHMHMHTSSQTHIIILHAYTYHTHQHTPP